MLWLCDGGIGVGTLAALHRRTLVDWLAVFARQTRVGMLEVMGQDYVGTARATCLRAYTHRQGGLRERTLVTVHALGNAFITWLTIPRMTRCATRSV